MTGYPELDFLLGQVLDVTSFDLGADCGEAEEALTVGSELAGVAPGQWNVNNQFIGIATCTDTGERAYLLARATRENLTALWNSALKQNQGLGVSFSTGRQPRNPAAAQALARFRQASGDLAAALWLHNHL